MPDLLVHPFLQLFQHTQVGVALLDEAGRCVAANEALSDLLGWPQEALRGLPLRDTVLHVDSAELTARFEQVLQHDGRHPTLTLRCMRRDGDLLDVEVDLSRVQRTAVPTVLLLVRDVTRERRDRTRLQDLQERWQFAVEGSQDGIWDWDVPSGRVYFSERFMSMLGYAADEMPGTADAWAALIHPEDLPGLLSAYAAHSEGHAPEYRHEHRVRHGDGSWRWVLLRGRVTQRAPDGTARRVSGTLSDTTERAETLQALERARSDLQAILDNVPAMIGSWDADLRNRFGNSTYLHWFGKDPERMRGTGIREVLGEDLYRQNERYVLGVMQGEAQHFERLIRDAQGQERLTQVSYVPEVMDGEVRGFIALATDITDRKRAEDDLRAQRELARVTLSSIGDGVITTDPHGLVTFMNPIAQAMTGWTQDDAAGQPIEVVMALHEEGGEPDVHVPNPLRQALRRREITGMAADTVLRSRDGRVASIEDSAAPILSDAGELLGAVIVFHDVSETRAMALRMSHLAQHDALTNLPNRVLLLDRVMQATQYAQRNGRPFALMFLDLDHFKHINDALGHHIGDRLLQEIARRLTDTLRAADTVSRQGGDEFVLLVTDVGTPAYADLVAQKVLDAVRAPYVIEGQTVSATFSIGIALYPDDGDTVDLLLRHADAAMYRAKSEGRNRAQFFSQDIRDALRSRQELQGRLLDALHGEQFRLQYQPKVDVPARTVTGVEALVRWQRPDGRVVGPSEFIPLAEETGLITALGAWVLERACLQAAAWAAGGSPLAVSVNISPVQFAAPGFVASVRACLEGAGLPGHLLELEITEGILMTNTDKPQATLQALKALGVRVAVDDFGTGYSSLGYLKRFDVTTLKIDRSFVTDVDRGEQDAALVTAVIAIARALGLDVIAEGVETPEQSRALVALGCPHMQGYLYSRPVEADAVTTWVQAWQAEGSGMQPT